MARMDAAANTWRSPTSFSVLGMPSAPSAVRLWKTLRRRGQASSQSCSVGITCVQPACSVNWLPATAVAHCAAV
eukprot:6093676-Prymnesium_polylepis.1